MRTAPARTPGPRLPLCLLLLAAGLTVFPVPAVGNELSSQTLRNLDVPRTVFQKSSLPGSLPPEPRAELLDLEVAEAWGQAAAGWAQWAEQLQSRPLYLRAAACFLHEGRPRDALLVLRQPTVTDEPEDAITRHLKALAAWEMGDYRKAWRLLVATVQNNEADLETFHLLTRVAISQNDRAEAIGWARKAASTTEPAGIREFFENPAFTILEQSSLYRALKLEALQTDEDRSPSIAIDPEKAMQFWRLSLSITNINRAMLLEQNLRLPPEG